MIFLLNWKQILFNGEPAVFMLEIIFRSVIMFLVLLIALRLMGKRGVKQLSVFETLMIIALGSAAGDPMFYKDVGLAHAILVFITMLAFYRLITWLTGKSYWLEKLVEGEALCLIEDGEFNTHTLRNVSLVEYQFFAELRLSHIEHLGQVRQGYIETSGEISLLFYKNEEVRYGLPLSPELYKLKIKLIEIPGLYACSFCGHVEKLEASAEETECVDCKEREWIKAINTWRVT